jgi:hypothetical protein
MTIPIVRDCTLDQRMLPVSEEARTCKGSLALQDWHKNLFGMRCRMLHRLRPTNTSNGHE